MAEYRFGHRGYNPSYEVDPWNDDEWGYKSDHLSRPMGLDPDGRRYASATSWNPVPNSYVVQTETYIVRPTASSGYGYPREAGYRMNYAFDDNSQRHRNPPVPSRPVNDRPPEVEEFLTKVQTEASRPSGFSNPPPAPGNWGRNSYPAEFEGPYTRYHDEASWPVRSGIPPPVTGNWAQNRTPTTYGRYPVPSGYPSHWPGRIERRTTEPPPSFGSGGRANRETRQSSPISRPINDIDKAVEYLKEKLKPFSSQTAPPSSQQPMAPNLEPAVHKRDGAGPGIPSMEDVKTQNKPSPELSATDAAHTGTITSRPNTTDAAYTGSNTGRPNTMDAAHTGAIAHTGTMTSRPNVPDAAYTGSITGRPNTMDAAHTGTTTSRPNTMDATYTGSTTGRPNTTDAAHTGTTTSRMSTMDEAYTGSTTGRPKTTDAAYMGTMTSRPNGTDAAYTGSTGKPNTTDAAYTAAMTSRPNAMDTAHTGETLIG
ncbi:hypothetical protein CRG98_035016 [Punica granatum]|uniref:Uncharacterized protein n=1 Tax=Punica granatum TaxID=22663 RepID=A0A2I0IKZ4_PUNGR|nr:hypothetical protein CRG98_035016 [Punica granatum]